MTEPISRIPTVSVQRRQEILDLPPTIRSHRPLYRSMPFSSAVEVCPGWSGTDDAASIRVLAWNAARCTDVESFAKFIGKEKPDVILLTEMDWGMARSGQRHTSREIAARLDYGYAFAVEFLELGLGDESERATYAGSHNDVGYHGAAILSRRPLEHVSRVPIELGGGWFAPARGQRRVGGRIALCAVVTVGGRGIVVSAIHIESESNPAERSREMKNLFHSLATNYRGLPVVIGGDLNTFSVSKDDLDNDMARSRRQEEDPLRFRIPVPHEPLFALARHRGFEWNGSNLSERPTHHERRGGEAEWEMKLDWFLTRRLKPSVPAVVPAHDPVSNRVLSDHDAIAVTISAE